MPNYTKNVCTIIGTKEKVEKILNSILVTEEYLNEIAKRNEHLGYSFKLERTKEDLGQVDFNRLIPTPRYIFQGGLTSDIEKLYGKKNCWLDWNCANWGTKWNASWTEISYIEDGATLSFWSAWTPPTKFIEELGKLCHQMLCQFWCDFADEDFGGLMGTFKLTDNGEVVETCCDCDREHYANIWGEEMLCDYEEEEA